MLNSSSNTDSGGQHTTNTTKSTYLRTDSYLGNSNIKRDGVAENWTKERMIEYEKCSSDPLYFIENYFKIITIDEGLKLIDLYDFQKEMIRSIHENRFNIALLPRQSSKTTTLVAYALWYTLFNGEKYVAILANKGDTAREILARFVLALENIPFFLQPGCRVLNKGSIEFSNNTKIVARATSASSIRGSSCVIGSTRVCVENDYGSIYYTSIDRVNDINNEVVSINPKYDVSYEMINKINGTRFIVESHLTNDIDDDHIGYSAKFKTAIEEFGPENFIKKITAIREISSC